MSDKSEQRIPLTHWDVSGMTASGTWAVKRRLASAMRETIERLVRTDAPEHELHIVAERLERFAADLAAHPRRTRMDGFAEASTSGDVEAFFDYSPLIGLCNPLAPPMTIQTEGELASASVTFGSAYEGPPGCVHGGVIASAFDEVLGFVQSFTGAPGMTGTLKIRYRNPTPLLTPLRFEARVARREGRKIFAEAQLFDPEKLCAEAEAIFVSVDHSKLEQLLEFRKNRDNL